MGVKTSCNRNQPKVGKNDLRVRRCCTVGRSQRAVGRSRCPYKPSTLLLPYLHSSSPSSYLPFVNPQRVPVPVWQVVRGTPNLPWNCYHTYFWNRVCSRYLSEFFQIEEPNLSAKLREPFSDEYFAQIDICSRWWFSQGLNLVILHRTSWEAQGEKEEEVNLQIIWQRGPARIKSGRPVLRQVARGSGKPLVLSLVVPSVGFHSNSDITATTQLLSPNSSV